MPVSGLVRDDLYRPSTSPLCTDVLSQDTDGEGADVDGVTDPAVRSAWLTVWAIVLSTIRVRLVTR